ncbi:MAG: YdeI/OmpD-associated family protein [Bacteroidetes bacterium]|nr:YdeI/OmpD-associated family protein [Bacteroidota bacterium]
MSNRSPQVDQVILKAAAFAQPILTHFRDLVHAVCPEVEEKIKWGMPFFVYKDDNICHMAAFKQHCAIGFWKAKLIDEKLVATAKTEEAMGHLGKVTSLKDLPSDKILTKWIKTAMQLNDAGIKLSKPTAKKITTVTVPVDIQKEINKNAKAKKTWTAFSNSHRKEYIQWITEAKTPATKQKRLTAMLQLLEEGKSRNWKYA